VALIAKDADDSWAFIHGKHQGKTLEEVAEEDPGYLSWMYAKASDDLSKEAFYALEDVMGEHDIEVP
jgi:hypothetical protein